MVVSFLKCRQKTLEEQLRKNLVYKEEKDF